MLGSDCDTDRCHASQGLMHLMDKMHGAQVVVSQL